LVDTDDELFVIGAAGQLFGLVAHQTEADDRRRRFVARAELLAAARQLAPMDAAAFRSDVDEVLDQRLDRDLDA